MPRACSPTASSDTVKYFTNEKQESKRFQGIMTPWAGAVVRNQNALFILHVGQSAIIAMGAASVMLLAGQGVMTREMTVGDLVLVNSYVIQVCLPLNALDFVYREARDALVNAEKLFQLLREKPEIDDPPGMPALHVSRGEVKFDNVSVGYEAARSILHNISFRIPPGGTVAVVGGIGSGKSTLARLLFGAGHRFQAGDPARTGPVRGEPHHPGHHIPALHRGGRHRNSRTRTRPHRRARHACVAVEQRRRLCASVATTAARGG